jgi:hypothetical protein
MFGAIAFKIAAASCPAIPDGQPIKQADAIQDTGLPPVCNRIVPPWS